MKLKERERTQDCKLCRYREPKNKRQKKVNLEYEKQ